MTGASASRSTTPPSADVSSRCRHSVLAVVREPRVQPGHFRLRYDRLDSKGKMTLRRAARMHHLGIGTTHARKRVLAFADDHHITAAELTTGEVLSVHLIEPNKSYWRNPNARARPMAEL